MEVSNEILFGLIGMGAIVIGFQLKINRCLGKLEGNYSSLNSRVKTIAESYLSHLDKKPK